jgi:NIPSNAP
MRTQFQVPPVAGIVFLGMVAQGTCALAADDERSTKVYELRVYHANPGKLDALHARFRDNTCKLFKKHGMEVVGFWTPMQGEEAKNTLYYILAFPSAEAQKKSWKEFRSDPDWTKVKAESEKEGVLVNKVDSTNLKPTDYSPLR